MKELDILFERFLEAHKTALANGEWPELEALLNEEDDRLWDWFQGHQPPVEYAALVTAIRSLEAPC